MTDVKNRMYNLETTPPEGVWDSIAAALDGNEAKVIPISNKKKNNNWYYLAAASVVIVLFCVIFFTNRSSTPNQPRQFTYSNNKTSNDSVKTENKTIITIPLEEKVIAKNQQNKSNKSDPYQSPSKDNSKKVKTENTSDDKLIANNTRYITIEGPQGQQVKISSKMATLIDSSETKVSSKPIWNKKINEWKEIMKANTLAPTTGNFLDIIELTKSLKDNNR